MGEEGWRAERSAREGLFPRIVGLWGSASSTLPRGILPARELPACTGCTLPTAQDRARRRSRSPSRPGMRPSASMLGLRGMQGPGLTARDGPLLGYLFALLGGLG